MTTQCLVAMLLALASAAYCASVSITDFVPEVGVCRAQRATVISATIENTGESAATLRPRLVAPKGIRVLKSSGDGDVVLEAAQRHYPSWVVEAGDAREHEFGLEVHSGTLVVATSTLRLPFLPPMPIHKLPYVPEPEPVKTTMLVGAHNCPLWEAGHPEMWQQIRKHPERTPALGFYSQENPEVADWETKWAVEHGVSFFIYCWYRASQGEPVKQLFGSALEALLKSKYADRLKFTIMWENQTRGRAGVSDEKDLMTNLMPFWIDNCFKHPSYLKVDNKPVLFIYRPEFLVQDLGSEANVAKAFDLMRQACRDAGFAGLYIMGEYRGLDPDHLRLMKRLGLDYTFAYCWHVQNNPTPEQAIDAQMQNIRKTQEMGILPQVITVSQAWSGWNDEGSIWKIPPMQFEGLLTQARNFASRLPANELGSRMLILDNWNEWGEGHYIAPYREYGFGYLDAVRKVFSSAAAQHTDLIPEDVGRGPYDRAYRAHKQQQELLHEQNNRVVRKEGSDEPGLVAWWAFDEETGSDLARDYSGHRLGGSVRGAERAKGIDGSALDCRGGCALIPANKVLCPATAMTIHCWVRTDLAGQSDKWIVNRIQSGKTDSGYRLGLSEGKPCFAVPQTSWSHHLVASKALPLGRWVHVAGTLDGSTMRIYIDGVECGSMGRQGPVHPNDLPLCLGSFADKHEAHFTGLLDEVKLYDRALTAAELQAEVGRYTQ